MVHMGRKLTVLWDEGDVGNSVMIFTCSCCHCCPSQCALPTQCPIGHLVKDVKYDPLSFSSNKRRFLRVNFLIHAAFEDLRMRHLSGAAYIYLSSSQMRCLLEGAFTEKEIQYLYTFLI